jgi:hypothetical protein
MRKKETPGKDIICEAIRRRMLLQFQYHGRSRVVEPYCHGVSTRGVEVLRAIQIRGSSRGGGFGFGKLWVVAEMIDPQITTEAFVPDDPSYNPDDSGMKQIHCRI